jgi:uncharacterized protein (DUF58 family)
MTIFESTFMRRLEQLSLVIRRVRGGRGQGEHRSQRRGHSMEFADYRDYTPGDDLRHLDWHIYARLERPFIRLFENEEELTVHLILDGSASMNWPVDDDLNKWIFSRRLVAALGYITLVNGDKLTVTHLHGRELHQWYPRRGRGHVHSLFSYLDSLEATGPTELDIVLHHLISGFSRNRTSLVFLVSDLFSPDGYQRGLAALQSAGNEVNLLHLLSPDEIEPDLTGDLRLHDLETGLTRDVTVDGNMRQLYRQKFEAWRDSIEQHCFARNINYVTLNTSQPFESMILRQLRQRGFMR